LSQENTKTSTVDLEMKVGNNSDSANEMEERRVMPRRGDSKAWNGRNGGKSFELDALGSEFRSMAFCPFSFWSQMSL